MKVILSGYEGSKKILAASSFLVDKYLVRDLEVVWLNYGDRTDDVYGPLFQGRYYKIADEQKDGSQQWAKDIRNFMENTTDEFVVFALDDYLITRKMDYPKFKRLHEYMKAHPEVVCARLCTSDFYKPNEVAAVDGDIITLSDQAEYSATTQYCIWRRSYLVELLSRVNTPWEFEIEGSKILNQSGFKVIGTAVPTLIYGESSCLSARWPGVRVDGILPRIIGFLVENNYLKQHELI